MPDSPQKVKKIFIYYWLFLAYTIAALGWWYIVLNAQSRQMAVYETMLEKTDDPKYNQNIEKINDELQRKRKQYIGEGGTFFLLIVAGAVYVFRLVRKQLKESIRQKEFMMAITHELKTPVAVSKLNLETILKRKLDETKQQKLLQNTLQETDRLDELCNNLLLSSQIEAGGYKITNDEYDYSVLVNKSIDNFLISQSSRTIARNIEENVFVTGDKLLLEMVVNNLVSNAIKYSPKDKPVVVSLYTQAGEAILEVADEGQGIADADKEQVFKKYYRAGNEATKKAKGTGLGLYLLKQIITTYKGKVTIKDNSPNGAIFVVKLKANN